MSLKLLSLFSGAGGLDLGFEAAGFETCLAVDNMPEAVATLKANNPNRPVFGPAQYSGDVNDLDQEVVKDLTGLDVGEVDMMVGGPPCQPFSVAAAQRFLRGDERFKRVGFDSEDKGQLVFRYVELVMMLRPRAFLIENVPGILSIDGGSGISVVYRTLAEAGYELSDPFLLNAMDFGVPQTRKRAFVIGSLDGITVPEPEATHSPSGSLIHDRHVSVAEALVGVAEVEANNVPRIHKAQSVNRYRALSFGQREPLGRVDRLDPDRPSKTVIAGGTKGGGRSHLHPYLARTLTVRECARLQTFPDDYEFQGTTARQFTLVGNAVPPLLGEVLARQIGKIVFGRTYPENLHFEVPRVDLEEAREDLKKTDNHDGRYLLYDDVA